MSTHVRSSMKKLILKKVRIPPKIISITQHAKRESTDCNVNLDKMWDFEDV